MPTELKFTKTVIALSELDRAHTAYEDGDGSYISIERPRSKVISTYLEESGAQECTKPSLRLIRKMVEREKLRSVFAQASRKSREMKKEETIHDKLKTLENATLEVMDIKDVRPGMWLLNVFAQPMRICKTEITDKGSIRHLGLSNNGDTIIFTDGAKMIFGQDPGAIYVLPKDWIDLAVEDAKEKFLCERTSLRRCHYELSDGHFTHVVQEFSEESGAWKMTSSLPMSFDEATSLSEWLVEKMKSYANRRTFLEGTP